LNTVIGMDTPTDIIEALGGEVKVAEDLGFKYRSRVANWRHNGIPRTLWPEILDLAKHNGVELSLETLRRSEQAVP
jgi:hypothetical protein